MMGLRTVIGFQSMGVMGTSEFSEFHRFRQFCKKIDKAVKGMFGKGELRTELDNNIVTVLKKKEVKTQITSAFFENSSMLKHMVLLTQKQLKKSLYEFNVVEKLRKSAHKVTESNHLKGETETPIHHTVYDCVHSNPKGLGIRDISTPPSPSSHSAMNILANRKEGPLK